MIKIVSIIVVAACIYGVQASCGPPCKPNSQSICAADHQIMHCRRMTQCELDKENCRRRTSQRPTLSNVDGSRCRNLRLPNGRGPCTKVSRPRRSVRIDCDRLKCEQECTNLSCYRSKDDLCQRLTKCQLQRVNCRRGPSNHLQLTHHSHCALMRSGEKLRKCVPLPNRG